MLNRRVIFALLVLKVIFIQQVKSQSYIADTIKVKFIKNDSVCLNKPMHIIDKRSDSQKFLSVYEKKKWLFFPVDQIVELERPLSNSISNCNSIQHKSTHQFTFHDFYIQSAVKGTKRKFKLPAYCIV